MKELKVFTGLFSLIFIVMFVFSSILFLTGCTHTHERIDRNTYDLAEFKDLYLGQPIEVDTTDLDIDKLKARVWKLENMVLGLQEFKAGHDVRWPEYE